MSSTKKRAKAYVGLPLIGGLLRLARQELVNYLEARLAKAGMGDVSPAQWAVTQQLAAAPEGLRLTELAEYAGMKKPSMSALVDGLEAAGYVERAAHPSDRRAQLVRFTDRGWKFAAVASRSVRSLEKEWANRIGAEEVETLRRILKLLIESRPPSTASMEAEPERVSPRPGRRR